MSHIFCIAVEIQMVPSAPTWCVPPRTLSLSEREVHVWRASFHQLDALYESFEEVISVDEQAKARRYRFDEHRREYITARGFLRFLLGAYAGQNPQELKFLYNPFGKPSLYNINGSHRITFNLSHAHGFVIYGFSINREIGVDIERIRPEAAHDGVAERFFSPNEIHVLRSLPIHAQPQGFFNCWTRKEAYIKARGEGLSIPLNQFDVSLIPGQPAELLESRIDPKDTTKWTLQALPMGTQYAAALAVEGSDWDLKCWDWRK